MIDDHSICFDFFVHCLRNNCEVKKWFESATSMVMQSVPAKRATNRLIRGNRTDVQKRSGSYSFCQDQSQGLLHGFPHRETSFRSGNGFEDTCKCRLEIEVGFWFYRWDWQELVCTIGIAGIPRAKCKESFFDEFVACIPKLMSAKHGHGSFDDVESPTGKSVLVGDQRKEEIECEFFRLEVSDPLFGSQSMVEPCEMSRYLSDDVRDDGYERFFKRHDWFSKLLMICDVGDITCCMENRLVVLDWARKPKKLESFHLAKPSDLYLLYSPEKFQQSTRFTEIAETEVDSKKKIQQINKLRWKEDSKIPSFTTLY
jgi:hypothetical protein